MLAGKHIVLGVSGSIAAYKAADLASKLAQAEALVDVVMTRDATQFVTPLTFRSLTHRPVVVDLFDPDWELSVEHVALAERADLVVVAPATANILAIDHTVTIYALGGHSLDRHHDAAVLLLDAEKLFEDRHLGQDEVVWKRDAEYLVADSILGLQNRMPHP